MILCCDFDFTVFFPDDQEQTARNLVALARWRQAGNLSVLVSNRNLASLPYATPDYASYFDYFLVNMGAEIYDQSEKLLQATTFPAEDTADLLHALDTLTPRPPVLYFGPGETKVSSEPLSQLTKIRLWFHSEAQAITALQQLPAIGSHIAPTYYHLASTQNDDPFDADMAQQFRYYVDFTPRDISKAAGVRQLLKYLDTDATPVTVGDDTPDLDMLEEFDGYTLDGSALAQKHPELSTVASVAELIEQII